jgi:hypothetical protein
MLPAVLAGLACGKTILDEGAEAAPGDAGATGRCGQSDDSACDSMSTSDAQYDGPILADGACPVGLFTLVVDAGATGLAVDETSVYWSSFDFADAGYDAHNGEIVSVPKCGGPPATLASNQSDPLIPALDSTHIYWPNWFSSGKGVRRTTRP